MTTEMTKERKHGSHYLSNDERRQIIIEALKPGANISKIAREHGIHRVSIYGFLRYVVDRPKERMHDAEAEASFRRRVWEMLR